MKKPVLLVIFALFLLVLGNSAFAADWKVKSITTAKSGVVSAIVQNQDTQNATLVYIPNGLNNIMLATLLTAKSTDSVIDFRIILFEEKKYFNWITMQ